MFTVFLIERVGWLPFTALYPLPDIGCGSVIGYLRDQLGMLIQSGGAVMWPLLGLSLLSVTLIFERCWFWIKTNYPGRLSRLTTISQMLRGGDVDSVRPLVQADTSVYGKLVMRLLSEVVTKESVVEMIESQRVRLERFMPLLSTIITVAPMLGILGTVSGIISSFQLLSQQTAVTDPKDISSGIAEALLTTAVGLTIAIVVLFPYNAFRAQVDRTLGRLESLAAAASVQRSSSDR